MSIFLYEAEELYHWIATRSDFTLLDVRNTKDFERFKIEGSQPYAMLNISYFDFMEIEQESIDRLPPKNSAIRIVCAKEGSAQFVAEILAKHGFTDVGYLKGGIKSWGNLLVPVELHAVSDYLLYQFIRPGKAACSYGLVHNGEMILFDPSRNTDFYFRFAEENNWQIRATVETHLQADYIAGSRVIAETTGAAFYANEHDFAGTRLDYLALRDGENIGFGSGGPAVKVLFSPGHTPGSTMYLIDDRHVISGDIIFINSIGRPDLGGKVEEWSHSLFHTIRTVAAMKGSLQVLPGHFISWQEAHGRNHFAEPLQTVRELNHDIYAISEPPAFVDFIKANMRQQPPEYATIRLVNANLKQVDDEEAEVLDLGKNECAASAAKA